MKKPRLFYFEDTEDAWVPVPGDIENIVDPAMMSDGESCEIHFKCVFMTDEEFDAIPEA